MNHFDLFGAEETGRKEAITFPLRMVLQASATDPADPAHLETEPALGLERVL